MAGRLTDRERQAVIDALASGRSCRQIAADLKRSPSTVSKIAIEVGHRFDAAPLANAHRARRAYGADRRAQLGTSMLERAEAITMLLRQPMKLVKVTARGEVVEVTLERPDARATCDYARAVESLVRAEGALRRQGTGDDDSSAFGQYLSFLKNGGSLATEN